MNHGAQVVNRADGGKLLFEVAEKGLVNIALHGRTAVGGAKGHAQPARGNEFFVQARLRQHVPGHPAGIKGHRPHGLGVSAGKAVIYRVINRSEHPAVDMVGQQAVVTKRFDPGFPLPEAVDNGLFAIADGGDGGTGGDNDAARHGGRVIAGGRPEFFLYNPGYR